MTVEDMLEKIPTLSLQDRKVLMLALVDSFTEPSETKKRNILEFAGIGAELYDGTDAQEYVKKIRSEWDERS